MSIEREEAQQIYDHSMECIQKLNSTLWLLKEKLNEEDFSDIRSMYAESMARLIDVCELYVYKDFPEMRPYKLD